MNPAISRCRFIEHTADLSAIAGFSTIPMNLLITIIGLSKHRMLDSICYPLGWVTRHAVRNPISRGRWALWTGDIYLPRLEFYMITCERCGKEIPDNITICPNCGTVTSMALGKPQPYTTHGPYSGGYVNVPPMAGYGQGYAPPQPTYPPPPLNQYQPQQQNYSYGQPHNVPPIYQPSIVNVNIVNPTNSNNTPVIVEVLLTMFLGIYGVGWLMAGETTVGVILLICSFLLYWPILIIGIIFTLGLGLFCLGPLAIGAIILNAILLNNSLKRKAAFYMPVPPT
jgi:hypothetical protein